MTDTAAAHTEHGTAAPAREHSENPAEGRDGPELTELRMHAQDAAEGPDPDA